jgi:hypothetical protein
MPERMLQGLPDDVAPERTELNQQLAGDDRYSGSEQAHGGKQDR